MQRTLGIICLALTIVVVVGCSLNEAPPFDPKAIERIQREGARYTPTPEMAPLPRTLPAINPAEGVEPNRPKTRPIGPTVRMELKEIIHRVVINNLNVRVAGYQASIDKERITEDEALFDPSFFANALAQKQFPQGVVPQLAPNELLQQSLEAGFKQKLESGGQVQIGVKSTRSQFQSTPYIFNPATTQNTVYDSTVTFQITQPLLQNFGDYVNRARILIARNDYRVSVLDWREQLEKAVQTTEEAYWKLILAYRDLEIQQHLLRDTESTLDIIIARLQNDTSMLQVSQARATVEQRRASLVRAQAQIGDLSDQLKALMYDPDFPLGGPVTILPGDEPVEEPVRYTIADQLETAMQNRLELIQQKLKIDSAQVVIKAAENNLLPSLNLVGTVGLEGLGNDFRASRRSQPHVIAQLQHRFPVRGADRQPPGEGDLCPDDAAVSPGADAVSRGRAAGGQRRGDGAARGVHELGRDRGDAAGAVCGRGCAGDHRAARAGGRGPDSDVRAAKT